MAPAVSNQIDNQDHQIGWQESSKIKPAKIKGGGGGIQSVHVQHVAP